MKLNVILLPKSLAYLVAVVLLLIPLTAGGRGFYGGAWDSRDIYDSSSSDSGNSNWGSSITADDCRFCHEDQDRFPGFVETNPDKHHLFIGLEIPLDSVVPFQTSGTLYECLSCHTVEQTDVNSFQVHVERDCLQCHPIETVTGSPGTFNTNVHHVLQSYGCFDCHDRGQR